MYSPNNFNKIYKSQIIIYQIDYVDEVNRFLFIVDLKLNKDFFEKTKNFSNIEMLVFLMKAFHEWMFDNMIIKNDCLIYYDKYICNLNYHGLRYYEIKDLNFNLICNGHLYLNNLHFT